MRKRFLSSEHQPLQLRLFHNYWNPKRTRFHVPLSVRLWCNQAETLKRDYRKNPKHHKKNVPLRMGEAK